MQVLENEIVGKEFALRLVGNGEPFVRYPSELVKTLGFKKGQRFQTFHNHKGEVLFRPIPAEGAGNVESLG